MSGSIALDSERCVVLATTPYNDGRRVVRALTESLGIVALWVSEGRGKNRNVGPWHPGALLELRGLTRKGAEGLVRFKEMRRLMIPFELFADVRKSAVVFFLCELVAKLIPQETEHREVFRLLWSTIETLESAERVGWVHAEFIGVLIRALGIAPEDSGQPSHDVLDLQTGEWKTHMGVADDHLPPPLSRWFVDLCESRGAPRECEMNQRKQLIQGQIRYLHHQMGGLREIKSFEVLESVFG